MLRAFDFVLNFNVAYCDLFQKFYGKMVKIKEMSFLSTRGMGLMFGNCMYTQRSLRDSPRAQGHILSRLAFMKYLNYWKIAGLWPAIFSGTPGNF